MKKFTLLFALILGFGYTGIQAQSHCNKSQAHCEKSKAECEMSKAECAKMASKSCEWMGSKSAKQADVGSADAAAKLASMDESIESKVCEYSGKVTYTRKEVGDDGEVKYQTVNYSASTNEFVAPSDSGKKSCSAHGSGAGSGSSANAGKASGADSGAGCCSKKSGNSTTSTSVKQTHAVDKKSSK